jgi:hypothetical protein
MLRRTAIAAVVVLTGGASLVLVPAVAGAAAGPITLRIPSSLAYSLLGHACTPVQEDVTAEGFDPSTGFPTGNVAMYTTCSGSGKDGGGHHTYSAISGAMWDDAGTLYSLEPPYSNPNAGPNFTADDSYGNEEYQSGQITYLQWATGFVPIPRVTGLSVVAGSMAGGQTETVSGSGFTNAMTIDVGSTSVPFSVVNDNTLTFTTPPSSATANATVDVTVSSSEGTSSTSAADQFTYTLPTVTGLSVTDGPASGGTSLTITGVGFLGATAVDVGGIATSSFTVVDDTTVTATTAADTGISDDAALDVSVISPAGTGATSPSDLFTYVVPPRIAAVTPSSGPIGGGTAITISGADLAYGTQLMISEDQVPFSYNTDGSISAVTPPGEAYEAVPVVLTTVGGTNAGGGAAQFTYTQGTPSLGVSPNSGPATALTGIYVYGSNFVPGEKLKVTYATNIGQGKVTICKTLADTVGNFSCSGTVKPQSVGPSGDHVVTASGRSGKVTTTATGVFTLT